MGKRKPKGRQHDQRRKAEAARAKQRAAAARAQRRARATTTAASRPAASTPSRSREPVDRDEPPVSKPIVGMTARLTADGFDVTSTPIAAEDMDAWHAYVDAHVLLPYDYDLGGPIAEAVADEAFDVLGKEGAPEIAWLRSIVILGHTPTVAALEALHRHASSGQPLADVARLAANECAEWLDHEASARATPDMVN